MKSRTLSLAPSRIPSPHAAVSRPERPGSKVAVFARRVAGNGGRKKPTAKFSGSQCLENNQSREEISIARVGRPWAGRSPILTRASAPEASRRRPAAPLIRNRRGRPRCAKSCRK
jgi:hypothetical protein